MAHAGTPTDLAKQPATSTTNGLGQALLAAIVILAIGAGVVMVSANLAASRNVAAPTVDHRFDQIEGQRGATTLPFSDSSYTQIEGNRGGALSVTPGTTAPKVGGTAPDYGNGKIQGHRGAMRSQ